MSAPLPAGAYALGSQAVRGRGRGTFGDIDVELILRCMRLQALTARRRLRHWSRRPFTDAEAALILERSAALQQYQEQLAERMGPLQPAEEARDKASSGSDLLHAVMAL